MLKLSKCEPAGPSMSLAMIVCADSACNAPALKAWILQVVAKLYQSS